MIHGKKSMRVARTAQEKLDILAQCELPGANRRSICNNLGVSECLIPKWKKIRYQLEEMSDVKGSRKRKRQGEHGETLEDGLLSILDNWRERNVEVTRLMLKVKADEIAERVGEPSVGWLAESLAKQTQHCS